MTPLYRGGIHASLGSVSQSTCGDQVRDAKPGRLSGYKIAERSLRILRIEVHGLQAADGGVVEQVLIGHVPGRHESPHEGPLSVAVEVGEVGHVGLCSRLHEAKEGLGLTARSPVSHPHHGLIMSQLASPAEPSLSPERCSKSRASTPFLTKAFSGRVPLQSDLGGRPGIGPSQESPHGDPEERYGRDPARN